MNRDDINVVNAGDIILRAIYDRHEEIQKIEQIKKEVDNNGVANIDGNSLSVYIVELSVYVDKLGGLASNAVATVNESYLYRKFRYFSELNHALKTEGVTKADKTAEANTVKDKEEEAINQYVADKLKDKAKAIYQLISGLQSRLKFLNNDWANSNHS